MISLEALGSMRMVLKQIHKSVLIPGEICILLSFEFGFAPIEYEGLSWLKRPESLLFPSGSLKYSPGPGTLLNLMNPAQLDVPILGLYVGILLDIW